jgi:aspartokinase
MRCWRSFTQAERQQPVDDAVLALRERHIEMARALIPRHIGDAYTEVLDRDCQDITGILHAVHLTRSASSAVRDLVAGFGEIWSTRLFAPLSRRAGPQTWPSDVGRRARRRASGLERTWSERAVG